MCRSFSFFLLLCIAVFQGALSWADAQAEARATDHAFVSDFDGSEERYVLLLPKPLASPDGASLLVMLHGHGSDRWQCIRQDRDECRAVRDMAQRFGLVLLLPDYRAATSWMGPAAEADLRQILDEWKERHHPEKVILAGGSMGGASALTFSALHPDLVQGVLAMNGIANHVEYTGFQDAIAESFGGTKDTVPEEYIRRSAELQATSLRMPVALTAGGKDTVTPSDSIVRLAEKLRGQNTDTLLLLSPEGGHDTNYADACEALGWLFEKTGLRTPAP